MTKVLLPLLMGVASAALAAKLAVATGEAKGYPTERRRSYEKPVFQLGKGEVVELLRYAPGHSQVRTRSGRTGWVETARLDTVNRPALLPPAPDSVARTDSAKTDSVKPDTSRKVQ